MFIQFETVNEATPGEKWKRCFDRVWPAYRAWFIDKGEDARADLGSSRALFSQHMPELVETYDRLCELAGSEDLSSRFLSMVNPPPYLAGCSQLAWTRGEPMLVRNYDFNPKLFEGVLFRTEWVRPVIGVSEGTWGLVDGVNADGLAACLSFGGRKVVGKGFGIPLIIRYVLETCTTVREACERLLLLPVHMTYSVTLLDRAGNYATVHLSPDRDAVVTADATCTNHQLDTEPTEYATFTRSVERKDRLDTLLGEPQQDSATLISEFLRPPLYADQYERAFGTLYTASYRPLMGAVDMYWPSQNVSLSFDEFEERIFHVNLLPADERVIDNIATDHSR